VTDGVSSAATAGGASSYHHAQSLAYGASSPMHLHAAPLSPMVSGSNSSLHAGSSSALTHGPAGHGVGPGGLPSVPNSPFQLHPHGAASAASPYHPHHHHVMTHSPFGAHSHMHLHAASAASAAAAATPALSASPPLSGISSSPPPSTVGTAAAQHLASRLASPSMVRYPFPSLSGVGGGAGSDGRGVQDLGYHRGSLLAAPPLPLAGGIGLSSPYLSHLSSGARGLGSAHGGALLKLEPPASGSSGAGHHAHHHHGGDSDFLMHLDSTEGLSDLYAPAPFVGSSSAGATVAGGAASDGSVPPSSLSLALSQASPASSAEPPSAVAAGSAVETSLWPDESDNIFAAAS